MKFTSIFYSERKYLRGYNLKYTKKAEYTIIELLVEEHSFLEPALSHSQIC